MLQPLLRRTWAPRGQTPILKCWARHDRLSVISAVTISPKRQRFRFYFMVFRENITHQHVLVFLKNIRRALGRRLVVVLDRLSAHTKAEAKLGSTSSDDGAYEFEWLPGYAPDLNPVEYIWGHTKYGDMPNLGPEDLDEADRLVDESLMKTSKALVLTAFHYAGLEL